MPFDIQHHLNLKKIMALWILQFYKFKEPFFSDQVFRPTSHKILGNWQKLSTRAQFKGLMEGFFCYGEFLLKSNLIIKEKLRCATNDWKHSLAEQKDMSEKIEEELGGKKTRKCKRIIRMLS